MAIHKLTCAAPENSDKLDSAFFCDFDRNDCGATLSFDNSLASTEFGFFHDRYMSSTFVTDVSSICKEYGSKEVLI